LIKEKVEEFSIQTKKKEKYYSHGNWNAGMIIEYVPIQLLLILDEMKIRIKKKICAEKDIIFQANISSKIFLAFRSMCSEV
jgi:hypothetical protein